jgi:hypothetical protein
MARMGAFTHVLAHYHLGSDAEETTGKKALRHQWVSTIATSPKNHAVHKPCKAREV